MLSRLLNWLRCRYDSLTVRVTTAHLLAMGILGYLYYTGTLSMVLVGGGVFAWMILGMAFFYVGYSIYVAHLIDENLIDVIQARSKVSWMAYMDSAVLILGFLGTLQGAIIEFTNIDPSANGVAMVAMLGKVLKGVGVAIYTTLAGAAVAFWTSFTTTMVSNDVESAAEYEEKR